MLACATVIALGVIVVSAISFSVQRAADFGPGFTTALLRHPFPWLVGLRVAPSLIFLIWLSTIHPDTETAVASSFLTASLYAGFWATSRFLIGLVDPLQLVQAIANQSRKNIRGMARDGERLAKLTIHKSAPPDARDAYVTVERSKMASGAVRHLQQAIV